MLLLLLLLLPYVQDGQGFDAEALHGAATARLPCAAAPPLPPPGPGTGGGPDKAGGAQVGKGGGPGYLNRQAGRKAGMEGREGREGSFRQAGASPL